MFKIKTIFMISLAAVIILPTFVVAEDSAPKVSYSAKKQGRVAFQKPEAEKPEVSAQQDIDYSNPANIEPAAGDFEAETKSENSLSDSLKLPRKN